MPGSNARNNLLASLATSGDRWVQFGILVLVGLSGFGNWAATWNSADRNKVEIQTSRRETLEGEQRIKAELVRQVSEIHTWVREATAEFHQGNADSSANRKILMDFKEELLGFQKRQMIALDNQGAILKTQGQILSDIHEIVERFDKWKKAEQPRGGP